MHEAVTVMARTPNSESRKSQIGSHGLGGNFPEIQEKISEDNASQISNVEKPVPKLPPGGDLLPNLNDESTSVPNTTNSALGHTESKPNRPNVRGLG